MRIAYYTLRSNFSHFLYLNFTKEQKKAPPCRERLRGGLSTNHQLPITNHQLPLVRLVVRITTDFPQVSLHGFLATGGVLCPRVSRAGLSSVHLRRI